MGYLAAKAILAALYPGWWAFLYQMPLGFAVAYVLLKSQAGPGMAARTVAWVACMVGAGGALVLFLSLGLSRNVVLLLGALVIMWIATSFALDKYLDLDWESSQRVTGLVCGCVWVAWLVVGVLINLLI